MVPAKFAPLLFSFFLSIIMSCVVSGVATLNAAGLSDGFTALWTRHGTKAGLWLYHDFG